MLSSQHSEGITAARRFARRLGGGLLLVGSLAIPGNLAAQAQETAPPRPVHQQVISANPFGLLFELFNAEYERVMTASTTAGFGGSTGSSEGDTYINADLFWRFYPQGTPLEGWTFGTKAGITNLPDSGTFFGAGFDANYSWLLGENDNFYVGTGFGLKRLFGTDDENFDLQFVPTIRLVNIGFAF